MRAARIKLPGEACYHVISRICERRMLLDSTEKERFRQHMRASEAFSGVNVLTYAIVDNHFHLLLRVPKRRDITDEELVERLGYLYTEEQVEAIAESLHQFRETGCHQAAEELKSRYTRRMYDLSEYCKTVKQRFTQSYNRRHGRKGTLWEEQRFKSVLVEGSGHVLGMTGAYIDLNAVRAGLVDDPKDYRFCGYGEAMGGSEEAREGIGTILASLGPKRSWRRAMPRYREFLYLQGEELGIGEDGRPLRRGFDAEKVKQVLEEGGELSRGELLRCRVRYFTDGVVLGSRAYVEDIFARYRGSFSDRRRSGARRMQGSAWGELCTARRLRLEVITVPSTG